MYQAFGEESPPRIAANMDSDIVELMLRHVSTCHRLLVCARVCRAWRGAAVRILECTLISEGGNSVGEADILRVVSANISQHMCEYLHLGVSCGLIC